jgi:hypothetical protein
MEKINIEMDQNQHPAAKTEQTKEQVKSCNAKVRKKKFQNLLLVLILFAASFIVLLVDRWQTGTWRIPAIVLVTIIVVSAIVVIFLRRFVKQILSKVKAKKWEEIIIPVRLFAAGILATLFALYVLIPNPKVSIPPVLQFNIIVTSATLGGLVLAGASNRRISHQTHNKFISVAKKLIYATILFLVFTVIIFWIDSTGGVDPNIKDFSKEGVTRGVFFYGGAISFYIGIFLFSIALIDLALALRNIGKHKKK